MTGDPLGEAPEARKREYSSYAALAGRDDALAGGQAPLDPPVPPAGEDPDPAGPGPAAAGLTRLVNVRATPGEAQRWTAAAAAVGLSRSDWIRARVAGPDAGELTGRPTPRRRPMGRARRVRVDPAVVEQLARIGNNLNQLARWANSERRYTADLAQLQAISRQLHALRAALPTNPDDDLDDDELEEIDELDEVVGLDVVVELAADRGVPR